LTVEPKLTDSPDELVWVQVDVVDANGVRNPLAMDRVFFKLSGPGQILGVGNGNAHAFEAFTKTDSHPLFYGKAVAVIRRAALGPLKLTVSAPGLTPATTDLP
jgi:beta-galactosidase